jgi:type III pantothenate kinase
MLLAIDVGNTEITLGLFVGDRLVAHWRVTTVTTRTPDEWAAMLTSFLTHAGHSTHEVRAAVQASVAPVVTEVLAEGIELALGFSPTQVGPDSPLPVTLDVDEPQSVGADRVVNTLAAKVMYGRDTIIVDFGTATTFDCITKDGAFLGGVIAPGMYTAADNLTRRAAKLPATELVPPERVIGRRTEDCIRSGVLFGTADAVDGLVRRIKAEWPGGDAPYVVATGGLAETIAPLCQEIEAVEPNLTLLGLRHAALALGIGS